MLFRVLTFLLIAVQLPIGGVAFGQGLEDVIDRSYHGVYSPERSRFHETLVKRLLDEAPPVSSNETPEIVFLAGPMGVGKSFLLEHLNTRRTHLVIDMDRIRAMLPEFADLSRTRPSEGVALTQKEAGYLAELILWRAVRSGRSIVFETSLASADFFANLKRSVIAYAPRYVGQIYLVFVWADLDTIRQNIEFRNRTDIRQTSIEEAEARYSRSIGNFRQLKSLFDAAIVANTTGKTPRVVHVEQSSDRQVISSAKGISGEEREDWETDYPLDTRNTISPRRIIPRAREYACQVLFAGKPGSHPR